MPSTFLDVKQSDAPGNGDTKRAQFLSSFGARHTKVNDQRCKVAMALARPMPPNTLKDQGNRQCADRCTKCPPFLTLTSCLPAERHAEESEQLTEEIRRLPACTAVQSDERFLWILVSRISNTLSHLLWGRAACATLGSRVATYHGPRVGCRSKHCTWRADEQGTLLWHNW